MKRFGIISLWLWISTTQVQSACPSTANLLQVAINDCTAPIGAIDYYADEVLGFCNNSAQDVIDCVQNLLRDCQAVSEQAGNTMLAVLDVDRLVASIEMTCNNTNVLEINAVCIDNQRNASRGCVVSEFQEYSLQLSLLRGRLFQRGFSWYQNEVQKVACGYTRTLGGCSMVYLTNCNADVHRVYKTYFTSISLPNCEAVLGPEGLTTPDPGDGCPRNAADTLITTTQCIAPFRPFTSFHNGLPSLDNILAFCNDTEPELTSCLSHLETCADKYPEVQDALMGLLNIGELKTFNSYSCQNVSSLRASKACVRPLETEVNACAVTEITQYLKDISAAQLEAATRGAVWFKQKLLRLECVYMNSLKNCVKSFELSCSATLGEIYKLLFDAITSSACATLPPETTTSTTTTTTGPPAFGLETGGFDSQPLL